MTYDGRPITIVLADDHAVVRAGLRVVLEREGVKGAKTLIGRDLGSERIAPWSSRWCTAPSCRC